MNKVVIFLGVLILLRLIAYPTETGKPFMTFYTAKETGGHFQNWSFIQDDRGVMYIGNGFGVQELSMTFLLVQLGGLTSSESATIALLTRLIFILTSLPGAFFLPSILAAMNEKKSVE